ncbi:hypothetical protein [Pontixanthobacter sp.]|uniref:hypothetical protein n=1 Tax=Pontixanthobacter sp. TaxID=2792078 RepID=UPI003C7CED36
MSAEPVARLAADHAQARAASDTRRRIRRGPRDHLRDSLMTLAGGHGRLTQHRERSWASITFTGTRHHVIVEFSGHEACDAGEHFIAELAEHEFTIPGQLVADAAIISVDSTMLPEPCMIVECELLLLVNS